MNMENKYFKIEYDPRLVVSKEFTESYVVCQFSRNDKTRARINDIGWQEHERHVISVQPGFDVDFEYLLALAQEFDGIIPDNNPEIVRIILMVPVRFLSPLRSPTSSPSTVAHLFLTTTFVPQYPIIRFTKAYLIL